MNSLSLQKNKKIGIFGLGLTGISAYKALKNVTQVICFDDKNSNDIVGDDFINIKDPRWTELDKILLSPGVPASNEIFKLIDKHKISITSDIDLLFEQCENKSKFIGITGTNGKSTTTALIFHILKSAGYNYSLGGNIGAPALDLELNKDGYVLELSSFQLDLVKSFKANIAVLLNITPDHLDRHGTMESYIKAKEKIFENMDNAGFAIIGVDNDITKNILIPNGIKKIPISVYKLQTNGVAVIGDSIIDNIFEPITLKLLVNNSLQGIHNRENIAASYAVCRVIGMNPPEIISGIASFQGLAHRMQYVGSIQDLGINFYNDSKATNADAASKSISALDNIYWLAGGIAKEGGIYALKPLFNKIKRAYLFGKDIELFAKDLDGIVEFRVCQDLEDAFVSAFKDAASDIVTKNKSILLAPAAASYDQFKNFEERGDLFIKLAQKILNKMG